MTTMQNRQDTRTERDRMGELQAPIDALYGAQTQHAVRNFAISDPYFPRRFIRALGPIKLAAAQANAEFGMIDPSLSEAIQQAAREVAGAGTMALCLRRLDARVARRGARAKRPVLVSQGELYMPRLFRLQVDEAELADEMYAFVTDPSAGRSSRPIVAELHNVNPEMVEVLESMVIDGVEQRQHVADYAHAVVGQLAR
jgi:hypothetical protein